MDRAFEGMKAISRMIAMGNRKIKANNGLGLSPSSDRSNSQNHIQSLNEVQPPVRVETLTPVDSALESVEQRTANAVSYNTQADQYDRLAAEAGKSFDQTLLTLSSTALGISVAFLKDLIAPGAEVGVLAFLYIAWILWAATTTLMLLNMHFSYNAMVVSRAIIDEEYSKYVSGKISTSILWEAARSRQKNVRYSRWIRRINSVSVLAFTAGMVCLGIFVGASRLKASEKLSQPPASSAITPGIPRVPTAP